MWLRLPIMRSAHERQSDHVAWDHVAWDHVAWARIRLACHSQWRGVGSGPSRIIVRRGIMWRGIMWRGPGSCGVTPDRDHVAWDHVASDHVAWDHVALDPGMGSARMTLRERQGPARVRRREGGCRPRAGAGGGGGGGEGGRGEQERPPSQACAAARVRRTPAGAMRFEV